MLSITLGLIKSGNSLAYNGRILLFTVLFTVFLFNKVSLAQEFVCGTTGTSSPLTSLSGGLHITSQGTLKVLVVFVRFKDDTDSHNYWPSNGFPSFTNTYIDPNTQIGSSHFLNLTNYYRTMSVNDNFLVVGEVKNIVTSENRAYYFNSANYGSTNPRYFATKKVLQDQVDPLVNFANYDNWSYDSGSNPPHINGPDGTVDMIIMIWRGLQFANWGGEASLGGSSSYPSYTVESGTKTIKARFGANLGSGVTVHSNGGKWPEYNFHSAVHEVAHWLLGSGHPYGGDSPNNHEFWGMLVASSFPICANAYEREKLNWVKSQYPIVNITTDIITTPATIEDFITTGRIYKYHPLNGGSDEFYYFENHQRLNIYDNVTNNINDKGIFVLHQGGSYNGGSDIMRVKTSNGQWDWQNTGNAICFVDQTVPKLKPVSVNRASKNNRDKFGSGANAWLFYLDGWTTGTWPSGGCGGWRNGEGLNNSFNTTYNNVFSNYSNPWARTWSTNEINNFTMEVTNKFGSTLYAKFYITNPSAGKPSKPQGLTVGANPGDSKVRLTWAANDDPDLSLYEVSRKVSTEGGSGTWVVLGTTTNSYYVDAQYYYNQASPFNVDYRIRVKDSQNLYSLYSDIVTCHPFPAKEIAEYQNITPAEYHVTNYPNPFNPTTKIVYQIAEDAKVQIKVYDMLGTEVAELVNEMKPAGYYETTFDGSNLSSGIYIYRITAMNGERILFSKSKQMLLIK